MAETLVSRQSKAAEVRLAGVKRVAVVPAFNEACAVAEVVSEIHVADEGMDVVVIDDGSRDATAAAAQRAGAAIVRMPFNVGIGGAMQTGYRYALEHGYEIAAELSEDDRGA
ncbi:MAG: glycosyltransferase, partial [Gaiellales bacterium]